MKRSFRSRATGFFIYIGKRYRWLMVPAIIGLAASVLLCNVGDYFRKGTKRFACTIFILLCFMLGNSFAFPVFQEEMGFTSGEVLKEAVPANEESDITLMEYEETAFQDLPVLDDEDVLEGYNDAELHDMENAEKYSLTDILDENNGLLSEEQEESTGDNSYTNTSDDEVLNDIDTQQEEEAKFYAGDWKLVLINKQHPVPDDYSFKLGDIKTIKGNMQCDERIIEELLEMMQAAKEDGVNLAICSPYRDLNRQKYLFNRKIEIYMSKGMSYMEAYCISSQAVTVPGASEHQIGLAIDIVSDDYITLDEGFADTQAGKWLAEHSYEYGFTLRYPKGKEYITSIEYEPWHFRYVGKEAATVMAKENLTLEEFWDKYL